MNKQNKPNLLSQMHPRNILKVKKDRIFILVMVIIVGNLSFQLMKTLYELTIGIKRYTTLYTGLLVFVDIIGIIGALWLIRSYRRTFRALKKQQEEKEKNEHIN